MSVLNVAVVRPHRSTAQHVGRAIGLIGGVFLNAWLLMLIAGVLTDWDLSYWHAFLGYYAAVILRGANGWMNWTHAWPKGGTR